MHRILFPIGVHHSVRHVLPPVAALASRLDATVHLLHAVNAADLAHYGDPSLFPEAEDFDRHAQTISERALERFRNAPALRDLRVETEVVRHANAVTMIVEAAERLGATWIAMPSRLKDGGGHLVPGSVTAGVIARSPVPVVLFPATPDADETARSFDRVLMPTDGSDAAETAVPRARAIVDALGAEVDVMRVVPTGTEPAERKRLRTALARKSADAFPGHTVHNHVVEGDPGRMIALFAEAYRVDLIVMAGHGADHPEAAGLGEHAEHVIRHTTCPVCVVPTDRPHAR